MRFTFHRKLVGFHDLARRIYECQLDWRGRGHVPIVTAAMRAPIVVGLAPVWLAQLEATMELWT
jgi:hypothetical protein